MHKPKRKSYPIPAQSSESWKEILAEPGDIEIEVFETGELYISNHLFLNMRHPNAKGIKKEKIRVPVYCYLFRHSTHGDFLIDAGLDRSFQKNTHGNIHGILRKLLWPLQSFQKTDQDIESHLTKRDLNLKGVFITHLHFDHISGIQHLPKDISYVVGKDEPFYSVGPLFYQDNFSGIQTIHEIDFNLGKNIPPLGKCIDLFGDGSFWAIETLGHRKGHVSYLINGRKRAVLVTGDACDIKLGFDHCVGPGFGSWNSKAAQESLEKMRAFVDTYPHVEVFFGHEIPGLE